MGLFDRFKRGESEAEDEAEDEDGFDWGEAEEKSEDGEDGDGDEEAEVRASVGVSDDDGEDDEDDEDEYGEDDDEDEYTDDGDDDEDEDEDEDEGEEFDFEDDDDEDDEDEDDESRSGPLAALAGLIPSGRPRLILLAAGVFVVAGVLTGVTVGTFLGDDDEETSARTDAPGTVSLALPAGGLTASGGGLNAFGVGAGSENTALGAAGAAGATAAAGMADTAASTGDPAAPEEPSFLNPGAENIAAEGLNAFAVPGGQAQRSGTDIIADAAGQNAFNTVADRNPGAALEVQPDETLLEPVQGGLLVPKIEGQRSALTAYARPSNPPAGQPRVAIVVIGLGHSRTSAEAAMEKLPPEVSLSFDVYSANLQSWMRKSWSSGHEVLISLPMESGNFPNEDAGPMALSSDFSVKGNLRRLNSIMSRAKGYVGMQTAMGSAFMADEERIKPVLETIKQRGLMIFESTKDPASLVPRLSTEIGVPRAFVNVELDVNPSHAAVVRRLADLEAIARQRGAAVGVTRALPSALERIAEWAGAAQERGIVLVPVSKIASRSLGKS